MTIRDSAGGVQVSMAPLLLTLMLSLGSSGPEQNDLRLSIARIDTADAKPSNPEFAITFENRGSGDFVALLGFVFAGRLYPNAITLLLTDQSGRTSTLQYRIPTAIQGRVDPYTVGLPRRATFVLRVSLAQYRSPHTEEGPLTPRTPRELDPQLPRGDYTLQASLQGLPASDTNRNRLLNLWTGVVSSNVLGFSIP